MQEGKAEKAAEALKAMLSAHAKVLRDGEITTIPADELVSMQQASNSNRTSCCLCSRDPNMLSTDTEPGQEVSLVWLPHGPEAVGHDAHVHACRCLETLSCSSQETRFLLT